MTSYEKLEGRFLQISRLEHARAILGWDEAVMMPAGGSEQRNHALAELAVLIQNLTTAKEIGGWLEESQSSAQLSPWQRANLRDMQKIYIENTAIPADLNQRLVLARMNCEQKWRTLRGENNWAAFMPYLQEVLDLTREMLQGLASIRRLSVYDTALSLYSNGLTTEVIESLFGEIKGFLPQMIAQVSERQKLKPLVLPEGPFPMAAQKALGQDLMRAVGFSFDIGRLDESHHPFCGGTPRDVRITTRYDETDFLPALMGVLHETGHAMYEQHLPQNWLGQPVGAAAGMAVHESQSLLMEMQICRSREFLEFAQPFIQHHLGPYVKNPKSLEVENLTCLVTHVEPGFIRVDADEVTYPAHVILRFEIERALLEGQLTLKDLPATWDEKMRAYLGLSTLGNDKNGCMQDVHWPAGLWGYFPAYTFGAVIAAQLFAAIREKHPHVRQEIARGQFGSVQNWLSEKVWSQGSRLTTLDLVKEASGPLSATAYRQHLKARYLPS
jgi:carboxypeptidase Taq